MRDHWASDISFRLSHAKTASSFIFLHYCSGATADWWSVGIILFELIVGIPPFNAEHPQVRKYMRCFLLMLFDRGTACSSKSQKRIVIPRLVFVFIFVLAYLISIKSPLHLVSVFDICWSAFSSVCSSKYLTIFSTGRYHGLMFLKKWVLKPTIL